MCSYRADLGEQRLCKLEVVGYDRKANVGPFRTNDFTVFAERVLHSLEIKRGVVFDKDQPAPHKRRRRPLTYPVTDSGYESSSGGGRGVSVSYRDDKLLTSEESECPTQIVMAPFQSIHPLRGQPSGCHRLAQDAVRLVGSDERP